MVGQCRPCYSHPEIPEAHYWYRQPLGCRPSCIASGRNEPGDSDATEKVGFRSSTNFGLKLQGVEEGTAYGSPALIVGGKMFACIPTNKQAEPDSLVVRMSFLERDLGSMPSRTSTTLSRTTKAIRARSRE